RGAIGLINKCEIAITRSLFKTTRNFLQRGRIDFIKAPAGRAKLIKRPQKMIGISRDRLCDQGGFLVVDLIGGELFGRGGEKQTKMLAQRKLQPAISQQMFPQLRRRQKFYAKERFAGGQELVAKKMRLAARRRANRDRFSVNETAAVNFFEPRKEDIFPGRFDRRADVQGDTRRIGLRFA